MQERAIGPAGPEEAPAPRAARRLSRRAWLGLAGKAGAAALASAFITSLGGCRPAGPPNVLFVTIDTLRADQLGSYGHPYVRTPALDKLASQGARAAWHMVQEPQTTGSHGSMFTGMYPSVSGIQVYMVDKLPNSLDCMAGLFKAAGYATAGLYGWLCFDPQYSNFQRGFDLYRDVLPPGPLLTPGWPKGRADVTTSAAMQQLSTMASQPFFLWVHYFDAHYPYQPPPPFANLYDATYAGPINGGIDTINAIEAGTLVPAGADLERLITLYQGAITFIDSEIGRLLAHLEGLGLAEETLVAVTGDHGEAFGEHIQFEEGGTFFHPHSLYNTEQRVPLLLRYPPRIRPGTVIAQPTQAVDLLPTFLELAGLPPSAQVQGHSLTPLLAAATPASEPAAFAAMPDHTFASISTLGWKLIRNNATGQQALFNLTTDQLEQHNLESSQPEVAAALSTTLSNWMLRAHIA
ncbi:MAG: sulfatase family protein [Chloroflexota bacterium]